MKATLIERATGRVIPVHATTNHPDSSHGIPVWVDDNNTAYLQVGIETLQQFYTIQDIDDLQEWQKYAPGFVKQETEMNIRLRVGNRIKDLRTAKKLTQQQLADLAGITKANICNIEAGKYSVGLDVLNKIATALGVTIKLV